MEINAIVISLTLLSSSYVQSVPLTPDETQRIDEFVQGVIECYGLVGVSVAAVRNDTTVLTKGYGVANIDTQAPVTENTMFGIGSITKQFTATLLAILLRRNETINWDTPVSSIMGPDFHLSDGYRTNVTSLRDLLSHKMGVPRHDMLWLLEFIDKREDLYSRLRFLPGITDTRTRFMYNNLMYTLAGMVAEFLENLSWEELIRRELFQSLGMSSSTFLHEDGADRVRFATPYMTSGNITFEVPFETLRNIRLSAAGGAIASNAVDMAKWLKFLLTGRNEEGSEVLPLEDLEGLRTPDFLQMASDANNIFLRPGIPVSFGRAGYGKGWSVGYYKGYRDANHGGDFNGYHAYQSVLSDMNIGTAVLFNHPEFGIARNLISAFVSDVLLGEESWLNVSYACSLLETTDADYYTHPDVPQHLVSIGNNRPENGQVDRDLQEYVGIYGHHGYGNVNVTMGSPPDHLFLQFGKLGQFEMYPLEGDTFLLANVGPMFYLALGYADFSSSGGPSSQIDRLVVPYAEITDPPVFQRDLDLSNPPPPNRNTC